MNQDILGGLKNAIEHGASIDQAIASFTNAGYNAEEVLESARALSQGVIPILSPQPQNINLQKKEEKQNFKLPEKQAFPLSQSVPSPSIEITQASGFATPPQKPSGLTLPKKTGMNTNLIVGILAAFIFVLALLILTIVFSDKIVSLLSS